MGNEQTNLITKPTVIEAWHATSEITLNTLFGKDDPVFSPPDVTNSKMYEPFAVIGQVRQNGIKYRKYLGKLSDLVNTGVLSDDLKGMLEKPKFERVKDAEISPYHESGILQSYSKSYFGLVPNKSALQEKFVHISLEKINSCKLDITPTTENVKLDPVNNPQLLDVTKIYIVYQTFYSGKTLVRVNVTEKDQDGNQIVEDNNEDNQASTPKIEENNNNTAFGFCKEEFKKMVAELSSKKGVVSGVGFEEYEKSSSRPIGVRVLKFEVSVKDGSLKEVKMDVEKFRNTDWLY